MRKKSRRILILMSLEKSRDWRSLKAIKQRAVNFLPQADLSWHDAHKHTPDSKKGRCTSARLDSLAKLISMSWCDCRISFWFARQKTQSAKTERASRPPAEPRVGQSWKVNSIMSCCCRGRLNKAIWHRFLRSLLAHSPTHSLVGSLSLSLAHSLSHTHSVSQSVILSRGTKSFLGDWQKGRLSKWVMALWLVPHSP